MTVIAESDALHRRVRAFAESDGAAEAFDALALDVARFQARHSPAFARLVALHGSALDDVARIPAVPTEAFRLTRVAVHDPASDECRFVTSGTTAASRGAHPFRTTATYRALATRFGRLALLPVGAEPRVVALATPPSVPASSSLTFMMAAFMAEFDTQPNALTASARWLLGTSGPDVDGLRRAAARGAPLLVLATSLALVALVEALNGTTLELPPQSVVMQTGGYKGRTFDISAEELRRSVARSLGIPEPAVVSEYGMTELTSQLYEGTCPGAGLSGPPGVYLAPPWLRVDAVDPITLLPVRRGEVGLARFIDLGNVDSALAIVTRDRVRARDGGVELLGREPGAPPRGCSLAVEALLDGASHHASGDG